MSREETTKQETVTTITVRCDFCDNSKPWISAKACANKCGKDVCHRCGTEDPLDFGDYVDIYCPTCWALDEREALFEYHAFSEECREFLQDKWHKAAKVGG